MFSFIIYNLVISEDLLFIRLFTRLVISSAFKGSFNLSNPSFILMFISSSSPSLYSSLFSVVFFNRDKVFSSPEPKAHR